LEECSPKYRTERSSKTLNKAEKNYCVTRRELLSIMRALGHFHKYLYGKEFHLRTAHSALTWLMSSRNLEGQTARSFQRLQEKNFTSEHRQGRKHNNADCLSRQPCHEECTHCQEVEARADVKQVRAITTIATAGWDTVALKTEQLKGLNIGPFYR
jgi:hypothetical protein